MATASIIKFPCRPSRNDGSQPRAPFDPASGDDGPGSTPPSSTDEWDERFARLNKREWAILWLLAEGLSNTDIAVRLNIGRETVRNHTTGLLRKLGVETPAQALVIALRRNKVEIRVETR